MSGLEKRMRVQPTGQIKYGWQSTRVVDVYDESMIIERSQVERVQYGIRVEAETRFWCRQKDYEDAVKGAKRAMVQDLHGHTFSLLREMRMAIYEGDDRKMLALMGEIERELGA